MLHLLHEFELSVWKVVFIHLLQILDSLKGSVLSELDHHYRQVPTFGHDTIQCFRQSVSELKRMAAHDFEDLLQ
ncbi:hypothetical protein HYDPIDRAFT_73386, partial [Hydnomerulius pinastri MD-312]